MGEGPLDRFERIKRPVAREDGLLVEQVGDETVIYDSESKDAHCLSPLGAIVFENCDGETTIDDIVVRASEKLGEPVDEPRVIEALVELQERDLLAVPPGDGLSRRHMLRKSAMVAGAVAAAPIITSIAAPTAAMAITGIPPGCGGCGKNSDCTSNHCCQSNAGKSCSQGCCVGSNNSCHVCTVGGTTTCTVTPTDIGGPCPTSCPGGLPVCCVDVAPC
jgi:hypothetical protein